MFVTSAEYYGGIHGIALTPFFRGIYTLCMDAIGMVSGAAWLRA